MKAETIHEHAKRIEALYNHQREIARDEGKTFDEYTPLDLVLTAAGILHCMEDWDSHSGTPESRRQGRLLRNFIAKWAPTTQKEVTP